MCKWLSSPHACKSLTFFCSNFFLDFDGWSHISALEQNFNPSNEDVKRKEARGTCFFSFSSPSFPP